MSDITSKAQTFTDIKVNGNIYVDNLHTKNGAESTLLTNLISHLSNINNPHNITKIQLGLSNVENIKNNLNDNTAPTASDDSSKGYSIGSIWYNITASKIYACCDASINNAVWVEVSKQGEILGNTGSVNNSVIVSDGTGGTTVKSSPATIDTNGSMNIPSGQTYKINGTPHSHANAIHTDIPAEISALTEKSSIVNNDIILIEDSENGFTKKKVKKSSLLSGVGNISGTVGTIDKAIPRANGIEGSTLQGSLVTIDDNGSMNIPSGQTYKINGTPHSHPNAIHNDIPAEISALTEKVYPVDNDLLLIEDSENGFVKKKIKRSSIGGGGGGGGASNFLALTDTPSSYTGHAGKYAKVKSDESGLEFDSPSGGGGGGGGGDSFPIGTIIQSKQSPGSNWLRCDGSVYLQSAYPDLFAQIGILHDFYDFQTILLSDWYAPTNFAQSDGGTIIGGSVGVILRSTDDGDTWTIIEAGYGENQIGYIPTVNRFVCAGDGGRIYTSDDDGLTWTRRDIDAGNPLSGHYATAICWTGTSLIIVANGGKIARTTNGINYTSPSSGTNYPFYSVDSNGSVVVAASGSLAYTKYSVDDGQTWNTPTLIPSSMSLGHIKWLPRRGYFLIPGDDGVENGFYHTSPNGIQWSRAIASVPEAIDCLEVGDCIVLTKYTHNNVAVQTLNNNFFTIKTSYYGAGRLFKTNSGNILIGIIDFDSNRFFKLLTSYNKTTHFRVPSPTYDAVTYNSWIKATN